MPGTIYDRAVESLVNGLSHEELTVYHDYLVGLRTNRFEEPWPSVVFQRWRGVVTLEDAYCFAQVWTRLLNGEIAFATCEVPGAPFGDQRVQLNQERLADLHTNAGDELRATVVSGGDNDGRVSWAAPITLTVCNQQPQPQAREGMVAPPGSVPLEPLDDGVVLAVGHVLLDAVGFGTAHRAAIGHAHEVLAGVHVGS